MLINLTDVLTSEGKVMKEQVEPEFTEITCKSGIYRVESKTPLSLTLTNIGKNKALIEGGTGFFHAVRQVFKACVTESNV